MESIIIGQTRRGEAWHVSKDGITTHTHCGRKIDGSTAQRVTAPAAGFAFHPWQCERCRRAIK